MPSLPSQLFKHFRIRDYSRYLIQYNQDLTKYKQKQLSSYFRKNEIENYKKILEYQKNNKLESQ